MNKETEICIVGGGPSGLFLGLLLAKNGIRVTVLESQTSFNRKFRGEVLQPRFVRLMKELNLEQRLEKYEHIKLFNAEIWNNKKYITQIDYEKEMPEGPYAIKIKQSVLLTFLYDLAKDYSNFELIFNAKVTSTIKSANRTVGVNALVDGQMTAIHASLVVGADGRMSTVRKTSDFSFKYKKEDFDLIWCKISTNEFKLNQKLLFRLSDFSNFIGLPYSSDCVQIGFTMKKDQWNSIKSKGIEPLKLEFIKAFPELKENIEKIIDFKSFVSIQSETFMVDNWHNKGCILIGDSAHCSSPLGAIGLSLAFETALVAAELIVASKLEPNHEYKCLDRLQPIRNREIRFVHFAQQLIISMTVKSPKGVKKFSLACMKLMGNSRIARYLMRRFFLGSPKITVDNAFKF
ncbi:hypothetical protein BK121_16545 [Paenibacillus odorifer]|uniref:FAD-dependent monooxygenase n=1 Tax=Paenibacillus odorifer TaxID=189426 RepID=UPI00096DFF10|nr:FAD-dependent monooxygenase [Paenibacillus odorifer]OMC70182.1 hypothetical protein BK121_16545 [Paenibacillus odorifer]